MQLFAQFHTHKNHLLYINGAVVKVKSDLAMGNSAVKITRVCMEVVNQLMTWIIFINVLHVKDRIRLLYVRNVLLVEVSVNLAMRIGNLMTILSLS